MKEAEDLYGELLSKGLVKEHGKIETDVFSNILGSIFSLAVPELASGGSEVKEEKGYQCTTYNHLG